MHDFEIRRKGTHRVATKPHTHTDTPADAQGPAPAGAQAHARRSALSEY